MKSKNKLILSVSLLLICGFLLTSLTSYFVSLSALRDQIDQNELPLTSDNIYSQIQRDLLRPLFISSLMASDTFLREWVMQGEQDSDKMTRYLKEIMSRYGTFTSFFVSDRTRTYYHADGILKQVKADEPRDAWYFRVRQMEQDHEINIDPDLANKDSLTVFINYRVTDYDGNFIGAAGVGLTISAVKQLIDSYQRDFHRTIFFSDPAGNITLSSHDFTGQNSQLNQLEGLGALQASILGHEQGSWRYERDHETRHLNSRFIPEFGWYLLVEQSEEPLLRRIRATLVGNLILCAAITAVVLLLNNWTICRYQRRLENMALTDKLTGACNRHAFDMLLEQTFKDYQRNPAPLSLLLFDLDNFKQINDQYGHLAGDCTLQQVVTIAQGCLRQADILTRWGGEEFLVLLKNCPAENALATAEKIRRALQSTIIQYEQNRLHVTASFGISQCRAGETTDALLSRMDQALYIAKQNGKNRSELLA